MVTKHRRQLKVIMVGDSGVGKTCIVRRLLDDVYISATQATIGAAYQTRVINGVLLQIWDTAGQERYRSIVPIYFRNAHAVFLVYDSTQPNLETLRGWYSQLNAQNIPTVRTVYVLANKTDVSGSVDNPGVVAIELFCLEHAIAHFSVSARTGDGVLGVFKKLTSLYCGDSQTLAATNRVVALQTIPGIAAGRSDMCFCG